MAQNPCQALHEAGTAVWLDQLSRELISSGRLAALIRDAAVTGLTSNPAIFHKAMTSGSAYDEQLAGFAGSATPIEEVYEALAIEDIRRTCDLLAPVWDSSGGAGGFVSLEVSPHLARDGHATREAARRLHALVDRPNLLIKVPGTPECLGTIEDLLAEGIGVNITLLFAVDAYEEVARAYLRALQRRTRQGQPPVVASVASFFVSRIDTLVDQILEEKAAAAGARQREELLGLRGKTAIANAKVAYQSFLEIFSEEAFGPLAAAGARVQRPLWASTSTKNPAYPDVLYVEPLIGRDLVNTLPMETLEAFLDHGKVVPNSVELGLEEARWQLRRLEECGVSMRAVTDQLLADGIAKFVEPYDRLLAALQEKRR